jgi:hypothetical protein
MAILADKVRASWATDQLASGSRDVVGVDTGPRQEFCAGTRAGHATHGEVVDG